MKKLITFSNVTVLTLVICGVLSDLNKLDVPYWVFLLLGLVYAFFKYKMIGDQQVSMNNLEKSIGGENPNGNPNGNPGRKKK